MRLHLNDTMPHQTSTLAPLDLHRPASEQPQPVSRHGLKMLAVEMMNPDFTDYLSIKELYARPDALQCLQMLCDTGLSNLDKAVKQALGKLLICSWGDEAALLRQALGLGDFMTLWEVSERFNDAFRTSSPMRSWSQPVHQLLLNNPERVVECQLAAVAKHPDYLRSMAQIDLQNLTRTLSQDIGFTGMLKDDPQNALKAVGKLKRLMEFVLKKIPNAAEIITVAMVCSGSRSAGDAFCKPAWEDSNIQTWFDELTKLARVDRSAKPSVHEAMTSHRALLPISLILATPVSTLKQALHEPWQWQFAYELTGHLELIEAMPVNQREEALAVDLGL